MGIFSKYFKSVFEIQGDKDAISFAESVAEIAAIVTDAEQRGQENGHDTENDSLFAPQMEKLRQHALNAAVDLSLNDMGLLIHRAQAMKLAARLDGLLVGLDLYADDTPIDTNTIINLQSAHHNVLAFIAGIQAQADTLKDAPALLALTKIEGDSIWTREEFPGDARRGEIRDSFTAMRDTLTAASGTLEAAAVAVLQEEEPESVAAITGEEPPAPPAAASTPRPGA